MKADEDKWRAVDEFLNDSLSLHDSALESALVASAAAGLPSIQVSPSQGRFLQILARVHGSRRILEIGTLGGYSTIWLARALPANGRLITLEVNEHYAKVAASNVARANLGNLVDFRIAPALESLPKLAGENLGPFDFIFIDADKANTPSYFEWALKLSRTGSLIVVDNVIRNGALADVESTDPAVQGMRRFIKMAGAESRLSVTALQTVGSKGYDGLAVALVTG